VERQKSRLGLEDVARRAGVGLSTVDRVLNERGSVSAVTERRVIEAARELGLRRVLPVPHARQVRIEVMLARSVSPFMVRLTQAMAEVAATLDRSIVILRTGIDMRDPANVASRIDSSRADGIIVYCEEHPANVAAISASAAAGRPVICVVTDVPDSPRAA
jgi:LacI family transcriptional regulator